ncbi:N-acetyltransferase [Providencia stuartii]|uniref:N-acetyltransferase n=1 Tax=Providencia stuartii TaxID=588 RepID=A0AAJ1JFD2_PROST|nr:MULTISPECIES: GNAT family N-acetyltransferase [Providencia]EMA3639645.1 N-acetyltransferase [Providencia stuartii]MBW3103399.1 N-acetyltransferase [Providencia stuartii]MCB5219749.1 N-acetyltransferase [Providencia stuartii]MDE5306716.1 N-acetyltransferase [Providencia stuartii]MDE8751404.1 N-acetyltransferase [Providencia thailandensis]
MIQYRLMEITDCEKVAQLLQINAQSQGGGLLGEYPLGKVKGMFASASHTVVAYENGHIVGVVFSFSPHAKALPALAQYITQHFAPIIENNWFYGPVCIDTAYRGKSILKSLYDTICAKQTGQPVAFINSSNIHSLKAHQKLGMQKIAEFTFEHILYYLVKP